MELSNNCAERSIKPFVMGRKANTDGGAQAGAVIYSLIETAKENDLDLYRYLLWGLRNAPGLSETDDANEFLRIYLQHCYSIFREAAIHMKFFNVRIRDNSHSESGRKANLKS